MATSAKLLGFVSVLVSFCVVSGRPNGAPIATCTSLMPLHTSVPGVNYQALSPQSNPYVVGASSATYRISQTITGEFVQALLLNTPYNANHALLAPHSDTIDVQVLFMIILQICILLPFIKLWQQVRPQARPTPYFELSRHVISGPFTPQNSTHAKLFTRHILTPQAYTLECKSFVFYLVSFNRLF